jgi:hypothetical protein
MKTFDEYLKEQMLMNTPSDPRSFLHHCINRLSTLEPKEIEDSKDVLFKLRDKVEDILTGPSI